MPREHEAAANPPRPPGEAAPEPPPVARDNGLAAVPPVAVSALPRAEPVPPPQADVAPPPRDPRAAVAVRVQEPNASARASRRRQDGRGSRLAVLLPVSAVAVLILSGIVYVIVDRHGVSRDIERQVPETTRQVASSDSIGEPKSDDADQARTPDAPPARNRDLPSEPDSADGGLSGSDRPPVDSDDRSSDMVAQVMIDLHEGRFQTARQHLQDALASPDSRTRSWARSLLEEIEFATSVYEAQKALSELNDEELEQLTRSDWIPPAVQQLSYPSLRQRFEASMREQLPAEFQRRQVARAERPSTAEPREPDKPGAAGVPGKDVPEEEPPVDAPVAEPKTPEQWLAESGLVHRGDFWLLEKDDDLKTSVLELNGLDRKFRRVDTEWSEVRSAHTQWQLQQDRARQTRQTAIIQQIQEQLRPGREILARWMRSRSEFTLAALRAVERVRQALAEYQRLADDRPVQDALAELEPASNRLGPSPVFEQNARRIGDMAASLLNDQTLVYWSDTEADVFHVDVIVNEAAAATLPLQPKATYNLVPEHVLREAGVAVEGDGGRELTIGGVSFLARETIIPSLRIGRFASHNIRAYVLPSNVRRVQGFLSRDAFPGLELTARRSDNVLTIRPQEVEPAAPD
ncbi:MAG: hypothetical protein JJ992_06450 [Planctomycetes bacterium]|nr:hypothetical protein [Planctomycetota bacterium]